MKNAQYPVFTGELSDVNSLDKWLIYNGTAPYFQTEVQR